MTNENNNNEREENETMTNEITTNEITTNETTTSETMTNEAAANETTANGTMTTGDTGAEYRTNRSDPYERTTNEWIPADWDTGEIFDEIKEFESQSAAERDKAAIGTCPVCGALMYEGFRNFYCGNSDCSFVLWKAAGYLRRMEKDIDARMAAEMLKSGVTRVKDLYSPRKNKYFTADLHMDAVDGKPHFWLTFPNDTYRSNKNNNKNND